MIYVAGYVIFVWCMFGSLLYVDVCKKETFLLISHEQSKLAYSAMAKIGRMKSTYNCVLFLVYTIYFYRYITLYKSTFLG